jgi:polyhydroxybutyrate depolymerase
MVSYKSFCSPEICKASRAMLCAIGLLCSALVATPAEANAQTGMDVRTIRAGGLHREFIVHVPTALAKLSGEKTGALPLVFVFHGGGGVAAREDKLTRFVSLAQRERFVVVYPQGIGQSWNDGRVTSVSQAHREKVDDLAFFDAMLAAISKEMLIDEKRVYATGISNGAIFSHYLAANRSGQIAAIAPVAGGLASPFHERFKPTQPVSVLIIQGTADPFVPHTGGRIMPKDQKDRGSIIATDDTIKLWTSHNRTQRVPSVVALPNVDVNDGCLGTQFTWASGDDGPKRLNVGAVVQMLLLDGGGHTWPGGPQYLPARVIGRVCNDFDATEVIWTFFKANPKR